MLELHSALFYNWTVKHCRARNECNSYQVSSILDCSLPYVPNVWISSQQSLHWGMATHRSQA
ncbi:UNVERIFIED_CONTAM: hypothetical protein FKN15_072121 [Acipenser sinensis]